MVNTFELKLDVWYRQHPKNRVISNSVASILNLSSDHELRNADMFKLKLDNNGDLVCNYRTNYNQQYMSNMNITLLYQFDDDEVLHIIIQDIVYCCQHGECFGKANVYHTKSKLLSVDDSFADELIHQDILKKLTQIPIKFNIKGETIMENKMEKRDIKELVLIWKNKEINRINKLFEEQREDVFQSSDVVKAAKSLTKLIETRCSTDNIFNALRVHSYMSDTDKAKIKALEIERDNLIKDVHNKTAEVNILLDNCDTFTDKMAMLLQYNILLHYDETEDNYEDAE